MALGRVWKCVLQNYKYKLYVLTGAAPINSLPGLNCIPCSRILFQAFRGWDTISPWPCSTSRAAQNVKAIPGKWYNNVKLIHLATHFDWCPTNPSNYHVSSFPFPGRWCRREWTSPADTRTADPARGRGILYQSVFLGSPGKSNSYLLYWGYR